MVFTELITNNAAAALMFPLAVATATALGVDYMPFVISTMFAASASFLTPMGYQTNLMVYGPGGYRFGDYARFGLPLTMIVAITHSHSGAAFLAVRALRAAARITERQVRFRGPPALGSLPRPTHI